MVTLANAFAMRGFNVDLVLATAKGPYLRNVTANVRLVDLKAGRVIRALLPLVGYLRRERPVAMLSAMGHANLVALLGRKLARTSTRVVVSERSTISGQFRIARGFVPKLTFKLLPWLYPHADAICTVSQEAANDFADFTKIPRERIETIYNPFDLASIDESAKTSPDHPWLEKGDAPVILAIGRLNEAKDFSVLIRAFAQLKSSRMARLIVLGEGELRPALESLIDELGLTEHDVQMPGFVDNPFAYLSRCNLFVLSSRREGLPGALIEAMACGAPVVSTDCRSGPAEILEGGRWGRLVPVGDVDALAKAMAEVLDTPRDQLPDVRARARDFEQDRAVDAYLRLLGVRNA